MLRRKARDVEKAQRGAGVDGVADRELTRVHQADDVAGIRLGDRLAVAAEETIRARGTQHFSRAAVGHRHVLGELPRADPHERYAVAMARIHVRLDLEDEAGEPLVGRLDDAGVAGPGVRMRGELDQRAQRNGSSPKFVIALPKNTGVCRPVRYAAMSNWVPAARMTSSDSRKCR